MKNFNFAIYGCGVIADFHARALGDVDGARLFAAADLNTEAACKFAEKYGVAVYPDFDAVLASPEIDVVCICTPNGTHEELAIKALMAGKNVVLEKPMAITTEGCDRIIDALSKSNAKITVISQLRTSPDIIRARELVRSGELGKIILANLEMRYYRFPEYYRGSWRGTKKMDGGGALMNQGIHGVDLLQYIVGPIKSIQSVVRTLHHDIEVEDTAVAAVEFESLALGTIIASTAAYPGFERRMTVNGTRGAIEIIEDKITRLTIDGKELLSKEFDGVSGSSNAASISNAGHTNQLSAFVKILRGESCEYVDAHEGKKAVNIIETIYKNTI